MAMRFDAGGDKLSVTSGLPAIASWTIMGWWKISVDNNAYTSFFKFGTVESGGYELDTATDGTTLMMWNASTEVNGSALTVGQWYHIAVTVAGTGAGQCLVYLNGVLDITTSGNAGPTAGHLVIADNSVTDDLQPLNGCTQHLMVYEGVSTRGEIVAQMRQGKVIKRAGLLFDTPARFAGEFVVNYAYPNGLWTVGGAVTEEAGPPIPWVLPARRRVYFIAGGGVLYTATLAGAFTPAGLVVKQVNKLLAGAASPTGVVRRQVNKVLGGSVTPSGNVVKRVLKVLSGVVTPVGSLTVTAIYAIVLAGALAVSGNVVKQVNKRLAGSFTPSGNLMKQGNKVLSGVVTPVGSLVKQVNKMLGGVVTPVGSLIVRVAYSVILAGVLGVSGSVTKQVNKVLTASLAVTGLISKQKNMNLSSSLGVSGLVVKQVQKVLGATLSPVGALTTAKRMVVVLVGALVPVGGLVKQVNKGLFASVTVSGGLVKQVNKVLSGVLSPVGVVRKQVSKVLGGVVTPIGAVVGNRIFQVVLNGALSVTGAVTSVFINGTGVVIRGLVPWIRRRRR